MELIADLMPDAGRQGGGSWRDHRQVMNGLMWKLATGAQWRDLPDRFGPWQTIYERFSRWRREWLFERLLDRLRLKLNTAGLIDLDLWCIDSTSVRASRSAAGARKRGIEEPDHGALGLSRGGIGTKIHLVTDGAGLPLAFTLTPGERHGLTALKRTLEAVRLPACGDAPELAPSTWPATRPTATGLCSPTCVGAASSL